MIKEIKYGGMTSATSDYESNDGELDFAQNCINEGDGIENIANFKVDEIAPSVYRSLYIHDERIIVWKEETKNSGLGYLYRKIPEGGYAKLTMHDNALVNPDTVQISSIGNTLIVATGMDEDSGTSYFLWKVRQYHALGDTPPMLELFFGLEQVQELADRVEGEFDDDTAVRPPNWRSFGQTVILDQQYVSEDVYEANEEESQAITDAAYAGINKVIAEITKKQHFAMPFFVRYAYRLYDQTLTMHSAPVLMIPSSIGAQVIIDTTLSGTSYKTTKCLAWCNDTRLDFRILDASNLETLRNWSDIVTGIDIFVSKPIYPINISEKISKAIKKGRRIGFATGVYGVGDVPWIGDGINNSASLVLQLPENSFFHDEIRNISTFYKVSSYSLNNLPEQDVKWYVKIKDYTLETLTTQEVMTDDYDSHFAKKYKCQYVYNSRHIIANIKKRIYFNQSLASRVPYTTPERIDSWVSVKFGYKSQTESDRLYRKELVPKIEADGWGLQTRYIFFPFIGAEELSVYQPNPYYQGDNHIVFKLTDSLFLNGSYFYNNLQPFTDWKYDVTPPFTTDSPSTIQTLPNKVYVSEVDNPFVFLPENVSTVGDAPITALGVSTQAVSDGQFGQYPFYVFSEDGTWALEVNDIGVPSKPKPISRLVATSPKSMQSIDTEFLFASKNGVYSLVGATPTLISRKFKENAFFDFYSGTTEVLSKFNDVATTLGHTIDELQKSFVDYIDGAVIAYDYLHKRIFFSNCNYGYTYVFSIATGEWYTTNNIVFIDALNSYPEAKVVTKDSNGNFHIVDLANFGDPTPSTLITRPLKLDLPDTFKTVERIIQRGNFAPDNVKQILYGSNDLVTWRPLASSRNKYISGLRGHSYKYFRLALFMNLAKGESLTGCTIQFTEKGTNKLR